MAPPTPPHPPGNIGDRKRKRIADDGASPSHDPPAALLPPQNMSTQVTDAAVSAIADKVGNLVGTLWDYSFGLVANIVFLSRKADEVAEEMGKLRSLQDDLMHRAENDVRQIRAKVSNQLEQWVSRVRSLAEDAAKCGGLPIALVTVGRAMSNAKTAYEWKDAIRKLDQCAAELSPGMEEVLKSLKFSFEMLKDEAHRNCLLYCALFPEDYEISTKEIIDMWICEGFLDAEDFEEDNIEDTRCRGNVLISELQKTCMLEEGSVA